MNILALLKSKAGEIFLRMVSFVAIWYKGKADARKEAKIEVLKQRDKEHKKASKYRRAMRRSRDDALNEWLRQDDDSWY